MRGDPDLDIDAETANDGKHDRVDLEVRVAKDIFREESRSTSQLFDVMKKVATQNIKNNIEKPSVVNLSYPEVKNISNIDKEVFKKTSAPNAFMAVVSMIIDPHSHDEELFRFALNELVQNKEVVNDIRFLLNEFEKDPDKFRIKASIYQLYGELPVKSDAINQLAYQEVVSKDWGFGDEEKKDLNRQIEKLTSTDIEEIEDIIKTESQAHELPLIAYQAYIESSDIKTSLDATVNAILAQSQVTNQQEIATVFIGTYPSLEQDLNLRLEENDAEIARYNAIEPDIPEINNNKEIVPAEYDDTI